MERAKDLLLAIGCAAMPLFGATASKNVADQEEDSDLFRKDKRVVFANVDFLYWTVNESANEYALRMEHDPWSQTINTFANGEYKNATFDWDPGVRINMGYFNAPHYWDMYAQYTFLHASGKDHTNAPDSGEKFLVGTWINPNASTTNPVALKHAKSAIDFYYNVADVIFSRRFNPNDHLRMNFFGGATAAFIHQNWNVRYEDLQDEHTKIHNKWHFAGAGLRLGLLVDWYMGWDIYLTSQISAATLSGVYENKAKQKTSAFVAGANSSKALLNTEYEDVRLVYNTQFLLGPSWQKAFETVRTGIFVGYEFTIWTNLHAIYRSDFSLAQAAKTPIVENSNVCLQGLTARWNIDF